MSVTGSHKVIGELYRLIDLAITGLEMIIAGCSGSIIQMVNRERPIDGILNPEPEIAAGQAVVD